ncbi:hypothetical protein OG705_29260 [Streptomyces sp. NBC_00838]|uniref:hypothetical protein n=1 Tax=Streptomyces sp. NBC_00838 TaxID=2903680 RepID=UPI003867B3E3|nr:hypothetical protein OG705_29260 [Streptomyces sp. NBC_00838]
MTLPQSELSPYDTGARCEPKLWQPNSGAVAVAMRSGNEDDVGNVDFTNDEDSTIVTVHVSRREDGMYTVHLLPAGGDDQIRVEFHGEEGQAVIDPQTCRSA